MDPSGSRVAPTSDTTQEPLLARPPRKRRSTRPSALKCGCILCATLGGIAFLALMVAAVMGIRGVIKVARYPHSKFYVNEIGLVSSTPPAASASLFADPALADDGLGTVAGLSPARREGIVTPLFNKSTKFNVYATIYNRIPYSDPLFDADQEREEAEAERQRLGGFLGVIKKKVGVPERRLLSLQQRVLWSGKLFEGVENHKRVRGLMREVEFEVPLSGFYDEYISPDDIRATINIVPSDLSAFDDVESYTSYRPFKRLPTLDQSIVQELSQSTSNPDVVSDLIQEYSVTVPLVVLSRPLNSTMSAKDDEGLTQDEKDEKLQQWATWIPSLKTRSHTYLLDETNPLNQTLFDEHHQRLRSKSCGQAEGLPACRWLCGFTYNENGHWTTRIVTRQGVKYGPWVYALRHRHGPKDILELPITRPPSLHAPNPTPVTSSNRTASISFKHTFHFSVLSHGRVTTLDNFVMPVSPIMPNATQAERDAAHDTWELHAGIWGNRVEGTHPWRRVVLGFLHFIIEAPLAILSFLYWYTRTTSTGIHSTAAYLRAATLLWDIAWGLYESMADKKSDLLMRVMFGSVALVYILEPIMIIKLLMPYEVHLRIGQREGQQWKRWLSGWTVRRVGYNKGERDTRRREGQIDRRIVWGLPIALYIFAYLTRHYDIHLIQPISPPTLNTSVPVAPIIVPMWLSCLLWTASRTGYIMQLILNMSTQTFAGDYALDAYLALMKEGIEMVYFVPAIVGRVGTLGGLIAWKAVDVPIVCWTGWMAWKLPRVEQKVGEEDDE